jgi:hypothetical protein
LEEKSGKLGAEKETNGESHTEEDWKQPKGALREATEHTIE